MSSNKIAKRPIPSTKLEKPLSEKAMVAVHVLTIQLASFSYDLDYELKDGAEIYYKINILNRIPTEKTEMDVLVAVTYHEKDRNEPLLSASCLTTYRLEGMEVTPDVEGGGNTISIPDEVMMRMNQESISHARALIALQTASTPYSKTHIALDTRLVRIPEEKTAQ